MIQNALCKQAGNKRDFLSLVNDSQQKPRANTNGKTLDVFYLETKQKKDANSHHFYSTL